jgi:hypothetical protein
MLQWTFRHAYHRLSTVWPEPLQRFDDVDVGHRAEQGRRRPLSRHLYRHASIFSVCACAFASLSPAAFPPPRFSSSSLRFSGVARFALRDQEIPA